MIDFSKLVTKEDKEATVLKAVCDAERAWRDSELVRADVELNKVQDGVGKGTVGAWREYRIALRDLPLKEGFPAQSARPIAPDAE